MDVVKSQTEKVKRTFKKSASYAVRALATHIETLVEAELLSAEEAKKMKEIAKGATEKYIKKTYGL